MTGNNPTGVEGEVLNSERSQVVNERGKSVLLIQSVGGVLYAKSVFEHID